MTIGMPTAISPATREVDSETTRTSDHEDCEHSLFCVDVVGHDHELPVVHRRGGQRPFAAGRHGDGAAR